MATQSKVKQTFTTARNLVHDVHLFNINIRSRELYLHAQFEDGVEEEAGVDYRMSNTFIKNINILNSMGNSNILIHQQTMGGDWAYGIAIYDALMACQSPTSMIAYAWSRSMSSITIQACDKRILTPNTKFMVHLGSLWTGGINQEVYTDVEESKKSDVVMMDIYASRCVDGPFFSQKGYDKKDVKNFIKKQIKEKIDWWMTAEEAVYYGFIDGVLGSAGFETIDKIRKTKKNRRPVTVD